MKNIGLYVFFKDEIIFVKSQVFIVIRHFVKVETKLVKYHDDLLLYK